MLNAISFYRVSRWLYLHHIPVLPILGTFLYGNFLTVENRKPNTQFSPISVPGISTVLIPLQTK